MNPEQIRQARALIPMSRGSFAKAVGVNRSTVQKWETGQRTPLQHRLDVIERVLSNHNIDLQKVYS